MRLTTPFIVKITTFSIVLFGLGGYGFYEARNMLEGPKVLITSPATGTNVTDPLITLAGVAHNISYISLNDRPIFVDQAGNFTEKLLLSPGYTIMKMHAQDKFGRETQQLLELTYTPAISPSIHTISHIESATSTSSSSVVTLLTN